LLNEIEAVPQVLIKDIKVGNRFRRDMGDVSDLAESIKNNGLLHPISIMKDHTLVAGSRRIEAYKQLGFEQIPAVIVDIKIKENGEIDENSKRKDFTPEEMVAVKKYLEASEINFKSETQIKPGNNRPPTIDNKGRPKCGHPRRSKRIAKAIGISDTTLRKLEVLHHAASNNPQSFGELWHKVNSNRLSTNKAYSTFKRKLKRDELIKEIQKAPSLATTDNIQLYLGNFVQESKKILDNSVDLIFTDPPYDKESLQLYYELALVANRVLKPGGSIVCYCGTYAIPQILDYMKEAGLTYHWVFAVKLQGSFARAWTKDISVKWKPLLWHIQGEAKFDTTQFISDFIDSSRPDKVLDDWEQSISEARHLIDRLTLENQTILDLMMGMGTTGIAALQLHRKFIGIEIKPDKFEIAKSRINQVPKSEVP
jgi:16S rRNA G966 N2-methylase RsmD